MIRLEDGVVKPEAICGSGRCPHRYNCARWDHGKKLELKRNEDNCFEPRWEEDGDE